MQKEERKKERKEGERRKKKKEHGIGGAEEIRIRRYYKRANLSKLFDSKMEDADHFHLSHVNYHQFFKSACSMYL